MAKIISDEEFARLNSRGTPTLYPWSEWSDGKARILVKGVDFKTTLIGFRSTAAAHANRSGLKSITRTLSETEIAIRFAPRVAKAIRSTK